MRALLTAFCLLAAGPAYAGGPVVVELYTSQACEECWRANALVGGLASRPDVLPLTLPVDYWDYLGWTDTLARPEFADRQRAYGRALKLRGLQTPLVVVDGAEHGSGLQRAWLTGIIRERRSEADAGPRVRFQRGGLVRVAGAEAPPGGADVWLMRYDPRVLTVAVTKGPNRGRTVAHRNVVREVVRLGAWRGTGRSYALPERKDGLRSAVLVQAARDGEILAAAMEP